MDLVALISFSPGFLLVYYGLVRHWPDLMTAWGMTSANVAQNHELSKHLSEHLIQAGYVWLFAVSAFFLARLLLDAVMVRRPLLEPNLSAGGLTFTGASLLVFLMANVITCPHERLEYLLAKQRLEMYWPNRRSRRRPLRAIRGSTSFPTSPTR